jgi:PhoH-like ATPase
MRKTYILDTSVLVSDPNAYNQYHNSDVIIPVAVLNELDNLKKLASESGKGARAAIRLLDDISAQGNISTGISLDNGVSLKVDATYYDPFLHSFYGFGNPNYGDTQILYCALIHHMEQGNVTLVSNDINLRVKAKSREINAIAHISQNFHATDLYAGIQIVTDPDAGLELQQNGSIDPRLFRLDLNPHECVLFEDQDGNGIAMGRKVNFDKIKLIKKNFPWGISAKNKEQAFAIDLIMDKGVDLVTLIGKAGTGKSLITLAAALDMVVNQKKFNKFVIYRPIQPVGNDIGYLPGTMEEKLGPWFQAILDNFEFLLGANDKRGSNNWRQSLEMFQRKGQLEMEAITYIRGRSITNSIILVDECQNLTKEEVKTILTRAGEGSKIILTGDIEQIDNSELDATNNGLTYIIEKFKDSELAGHITFVQGERSRLASRAAEIL